MPHNPCLTFWGHFIHADIKDIDIQDGQGIRTSLYVSGCHFHCKECHNKEAWDFSFGKKFDDFAKKRIFKNLEKDYIEGLSLLGGEPLELINQQALVPFIKEVKEKFPNKDIWCWTGYDFEKDILNNMYKKYNFTRELLKYIDIIVDGQFEIEKHLVNLKFRGSYNQRKIDVQESIKKNTLIRLQFGDEYRYEKNVAKESIAKENINYIPNIVVQVTQDITENNIFSPKVVAKTKDNLDIKEAL